MFRVIGDFKGIRELLSFLRFGGFVVLEVVVGFSKFFEMLAGVFGV